MMLRSLSSPPLQGGRGKAKAPPPVLFGRRRVRPWSNFFLHRLRHFAKTRGTPGHRSSRGPLHERGSSAEAVVTTARRCPGVPRHPVSTSGTSSAPARGTR